MIEDFFLGNGHELPKIYPTTNIYLDCDFLINTLSNYTKVYLNYYIQNTKQCIQEQALRNTPPAIFLL